MKGCLGNVKQDVKVTGNGWAAAQHTPGWSLVQRTKLPESGTALPTPSWVYKIFFLELAKFQVAKTHAAQGSQVASYLFEVAERK